MRALLLRALCSPRLPAAVCLGVGAVSVLPAAYGAWKVATIVVDQLHGPALGTDFLNLYAGANLLVTEPGETYRFDAQQAVQRSLTGVDDLLVPFYLPPYAALLVGWLGWLAYPLAYLVWLIIGLACMLVAAWWLAPRWTRWHALVWLGMSLLFLPGLLGLAQGQTSALMLLCAAAFTRGMLERRHASPGLTVATVGLALKPQFAPLFLATLVLGRRWTGFLGAAGLVAVLNVAALVRLGADGSTAYAAASRQKMVETLSAEPTFLLGPTLLHASHWFLGVNATAHVVTAVLELAVVVAFLYVWRRGPATDEAYLLQLAMLPIASIIAAPYALVYELTIWLISFWLLWRYTASRPAARAGLLWLTAGVWVAGDLGVELTRTGGADFAALLGLGAVAFVVWLFHVHGARSGTLGLKLNRSSPRGSE